MCTELHDILLLFFNVTYIKYQNLLLCASQEVVIMWVIVVGVEIVVVVIEILVLVVVVVVVVVVIYLKTLFSNFDYSASNERVICELWIKKDVEGTGHVLIKDLIPSKTSSNHRQDSRSPGRDLNWDLLNTKQEC
jgi:hypothetical protein